MPVSENGDYQVTVMVRCSVGMADLIAMQAKHEGVTKSDLLRHMAAIYFFNAMNEGKFCKGSSQDESISSLTPSQCREINEAVRRYMGSLERHPQELSEFLSLTKKIMDFEKIMLSLNRDQKKQVAVVIAKLADRCQAHGKRKSYLAAHNLPSDYLDICQIRNCFPYDREWNPENIQELWNPVSQPEVGTKNV